MSGLRNWICGVCFLAALLPAPPAGATSYLPSQPTDQIGDATVVPATGGYINVDYSAALNATASSTDPSCGLVGTRTLWYRYTSPVTNPLLLSFDGVLSSAYDRPRVAVWSGSPGALTAVQCSPDASQAEFVAQPGVTYYFELSSPAASQPNYGGALIFSVDPLQTAAPANDLFQFATPVSSLPLTDSSNLPASPANIYEPGACPAAWGLFPGGYPPDNTVWYSFVAPSAGALDVLFTDASLSVYNGTSRNFQPYLAVYTSASGSLDDLQRVGCSYDAPYDYQSGLRFTPVAGQRYYAEFGGYGFTSALSNSAVPLAIRAAPAATAGSLSVSPSGRLKHNYTWADGWFEISYAYLDVSYTCAAAPAQVLFSVTLSQNGQTATGTGSGSCKSGSGSEKLSLRVPNSFVFGNATATVQVYDYPTNFQAISPVTPVALQRH